MKFPISLLRKLDEFVGTLDEEDCYSDRHIAIREAARLLIYLTHDEYYDVVNTFDIKYNDIADVCRKFVEG